jgi:hypothetical protein
MIFPEWNGMAFEAQLGRGGKNIRTRNASLLFEN